MVWVREGSCVCVCVVAGGGGDDGSVGSEAMSSV